MAKMKANITSYDDAKQFLSTGTREIAGAIERQLGHNTKVWRVKDNPYYATNQPIHIEYHDTTIITYYPDGWIELNSGGYQTSTTKQRFNACSPFHIYQQNWYWFISMPNGPIPFRDGALLPHPSYWRKTNV